MALSGGLLVAVQADARAGEGDRAQAAAEPFDEAAIYQVHYPGWFLESFMVLPDDAAAAAEAGKRGLFLFFTTQGCSYCHLFIEKSLGDPELSARLRKHFDSIGLEIFSDAEMIDFDGGETRVKTFALEQGVEFAPTLLFVDTQGEPLLRLTGYYSPERFSQMLDFLTDSDAEGQTWRDYLAAQEQAGDETEPGADDETLRSDPLFAEPPFALDRSRVAADRPLLVLFEEAGCARCDRFHDQVLGDPEIRDRLSAFDVVRLRSDDEQSPVLTPDGQRTRPGAWYDSFGFTQLPALVFFNEQGKAVLSTDALVLESRMNNAIGFVTDRAYDRGWNYQRYARSQALEKLRRSAP
jgi:thioredoxin-related protein